MKNVKIGLIGFGTIGSGVVKWIQQNGGLISARCGVQLELTRIADLDITTDRGVAVNPDVLTTNYEDLIKDPNLDVIVELVGGTTIARKIVLAALEAGKPVVTANKALLAHHGDELFAAAEKSASDIYYEASVGGGIPIIKALREGLAANHIQHIYGILNGTCNYILTRMEREGADFDEVLGDAQELGFAEADPAADIDGRDTAHKACILASLAYGEWFGMGPIFIEGIRNLDSQDIKNAAEAGYKIKLLGIIKLESGNIQMRVHPTLVPTASTLAEVSDEYNAIWVTGDVVGDTMYYGRGAGRDATASAVIADLIDVALNLKFDSSHRVAAFRPHRSYNDVVPMDAIKCRYYIRLSVDDRPNVLARITHILGEAEISIASVLQNETDSDKLPVILITHLARESNVMSALSKIEALESVNDKPVLLRIEDI